MTPTVFKFETARGEGLFVWIPEGAVCSFLTDKYVEGAPLCFGFEPHFYQGTIDGMIKLPPGGWQLLGCLKDVTEEQAGELVDQFEDVMFANPSPLYWLLSFARSMKLSDNSVLLFHPKNRQ